MTDHDVRPDPDAEDLLAGQPPEAQPPPELRAHVVDALRARALSRGAPPLRPTLAWWTLTAAAALVAFLGGRMTAATPESPRSGSASRVRRINRSRVPVKRSDPDMRDPGMRSIPCSLRYQPNHGRSDRPVEGAP
jgi:hypothetical protein